MKKVFIAISLVTLFISCGPSPEQRAAIENEVMQKLKTKEDSIAAVKNNEEAIKNAQKQHDDSIENSVAKKYQDKENLQSMNSQYAELQRILVECDAKLTVLKDRKNNDAGFKLGRTKAEREQQLSNDEKNIDNLKLQMLNIQNQMQALKTKMSH